MLHCTSGSSPAIGHLLAPSPTFNILMIEDNPGDATLALEALVEIRAPVTVHGVANAIHGLAFLTKQGEYSWKPSIDLVLMDINLPLLDGFAALTAIRSSPAMRENPVWMLSSSQREEDRLLSMRLGADAYRVKPASYEGYLQLARDIVAYLRQRHDLRVRGGQRPLAP